jgi:hypothetical protein
MTSEVTNPPLTGSLMGPVTVHTVLTRIVVGLP